ncbi:GNAT family N-acetyltransferase [Catalinimonas sp. 4WD22]|uniref:GNAT family N-acetyltransferase n=1 Tax=Catalinimonas locisalis TaxID=3133978 RepID=UPI0031018132
MRLASERLIYKKFTHAEFPAYASWYMNEEVMKYITGRALKLEETKVRFAKAMETNEKYHEVGLFSVKNKDNLTFVGIAKLVYMDELKAEIGYGMLPEFWGKGYASEILSTLVEYAKVVLHLRELIAVVDPDNIASQKVLAKQAFSFLETGTENNNPAEYYHLLLSEKNPSNNHDSA